MARIALGGEAPETIRRPYEVLGQKLRAYFGSIRSILKLIGICQRLKLTGDGQRLAVSEYLPACLGDVDKMALDFAQGG